MSIQLSNPLKWDHARTHVNAIQISNNEVLVFGGFSEKCESFILLIMESIVTCTRDADLEKGANFSYSSAPIFNGEEVFAGDSSRNINIYSLNEKKWKVIIHKL